MSGGFVDVVNRGMGLIAPGDDPVLKMYEFLVKEGVNAL